MTYSDNIKGPSVFNLSVYLHESQEFTRVLNNRETFENLFQDTLREKICKLQCKAFAEFKKSKLCKYCLKEGKKLKKDHRYLINNSL